MAGGRVAVWRQPELAEAEKAGKAGRGHEGGNA
jgi:hypothetical protein